MEYLKEKYINFFTDFGFKKLFGSEPSKDCLIDFLNSLLEGMEEPIKELQFRKSEHLGASEIDRRAIFDLYCVSETGSRFIVELQKAKQKFFKDRSVFYSTFPIQEQAKKGDWNFKLDAVYTIGILDFVFENDSDTPEKYIYNVKLSELDSHEVFYNKLTFVYVEMPRFTKELSELKTHQDKWIYALKNLSNLTGVPEGFREDVFLKFFDIAEIAQLDPVERDSYEDSLKVYRDLKNTIDTALEEGWEDGLEQGIQKGRAEGRAEGERSNSVKIARNLLLSGMSVEDVAKMTGLPIDEVKAIKQDL